jgi:hypothetical protein
MLVAALLLAGSAAASGIAPPDATVIRSPTARSLTAAQMFALADRANSRGNAEMAAAIYRAMVSDPTADVRAEARFRLAMLEAKRGRLREAAVLFRRVIDQRPDAQRARLELAGTLARMGDEQAALRELRALRSAHLPPNVARFVDQLSASLQARKPFGIHLEMAIAPDSNINHATHSDTLGTIFGDFTIDDESRAKSGIGAAVRGFAHGRLDIADGLALSGRVNADANLYRRKDFDDIALDVAAGPEWRLGRTRLNLEGGAGQHWYGLKLYDRSFRIAAAAVTPLGAVSQLRIDAAAREVDNRLNRLQDGRGMTGQVRLERTLSPRLLVSGSIALDRFKAREPAYSTRSWQAGISAYRDIGTATLSAGVEVGRLKADDRLQLLPEARSDRMLRLSLGTVFRRLSFAGFAPMSRLVFERNKSSVEFYDYKRFRTEVGIARAF